MRSFLRTLAEAIIFGTATALPAAELGDINGDGRVSFGDAYLLSRWKHTGLQAYEPAAGSIDFDGWLRCTEGSPGSTFIYLEALRRASPAPLPHFIERWPGPAGPEAPLPEADDIVKLDVLPLVHSAGESQLDLQVRMTTGIPLHFVGLLLSAEGLDLRPPHPGPIQYGPKGTVKSSTSFYLLSGGLLPYPSDNLAYGTDKYPYAVGESILKLPAVLPRGAPPGRYDVRILPASEVVTAFGEVIRPAAAAGTLEITRTVPDGHVLPFPPLEFADLEGRRIGGSTEVRITDAEGSPGDVVTVKVQMRTTTPINTLRFFILFDGRSLRIDEVGFKTPDVKPLYVDPETGTVDLRDHRWEALNGYAYLDASAYVHYSYLAGIGNNDILAGQYDPYSVQMPSATLKFIQPFGEWIDLLEIRLRIRPDTEGRGWASLGFLDDDAARGDESRRAYANFLPYADEASPAGQAACSDPASWWRYDTVWKPGRVTILGGGEPPAEIPPPMDPELVKARFYVGESGDPGPDGEPEPLPVRAKPGDTVRLPVGFLTGVPVWKLRMVFGFDAARLELEGFEVNFIDFDGNPFTTIISRESWSAFNEQCSITEDNTRFCNIGLLPYLAWWFDERDNVPSDAMFVDLSTRYLYGAQGGLISWDPGAFYRIGAVIFKVRGDAAPGRTEVSGREILWKPEHWFPSLFWLEARSSGYPVLPGGPRAVIDAPRADVPAVLVRPGVIIVSGPGEEPAFLRGDSNGDVRLNLSDAVHTLSALFLGTARLDCDDAADANDDGALNLADPVYSLVHLYLGGPAPPAPFPEAGADPTEDGLEACER